MYSEQRNPYKGTPSRAWLRVRLTALDGSPLEFDVLADTGNPFSSVVGLPVLQQFKHMDAHRVSTNFGDLLGGWLRVGIPDVGMDQLVLGYGSDEVVEATRQSSPDLQGMAGLPLLQLTEYGGIANSFWVRSAGSPS